MFVTAESATRPHESLNYDTPMHYEQTLLKQDCSTLESNT